MADYFEVLGVQRKYHFSDGELEKRFLALSKEWHPDRFAKAEPRERLMAVQKTTAINDAYRTLKDKLKRAEYLLKLEGLDVADEKGSIKPEPHLLAEAMERGEAIAEARAANDRAALDELRERILHDGGHSREFIDTQFKRWEAGERDVLPRIAQALIALRFDARLLEQLEGNEA